MKLTLDGLKPGMAAVVTELGCREGLKRRLEDFGLVQDTCVRCRYQSPGGDLSALEVRGSVVAVRRADLARITARRL